MIVGSVIFAVLWLAIALFVRRYPETMAGYNTMPQAERDKIDVEKVGRLISNVMFAVVVTALIAPLMPNRVLWFIMFVGIPAVSLIAVAIYVNVRKKKFLQ